MTDRSLFLSRGPFFFFLFFFFFFLFFSLCLKADRLKCAFPMKSDAIPIVRRFRGRNANILILRTRRREAGASHQRSTPLSRSSPSRSTLRGTIKSRSARFLVNFASKFKSGKVKFAWQSVARVRFSSGLFQQARGEWTHT